MRLSSAARALFLQIAFGAISLVSCLAHDPGLSGLAVTLRGDQLEAVATFARTDIRGYLSPEADTPPTTEQLTKLAPKILQVSDGKKSIAPDAIAVNPTAANNDFEFRLTYSKTGAAPGEKWMLRSALIAELAPGHRQYLSVQNAEGRVIAEQLLRADFDSAQIAFQTPPKPAVRSAAFLAFVLMGMNHILTGVDHLLFVLGLVLIVRDRWMLFKTITAFTIAHSITLAIATLGYATAPVAPLNVAIALSICVLGPEILRAQQGGTSFTLRNPWLVAFAFGLLHGFGFASGLVDLGIPRSQIPAALLSFNLGVEAGQLLFVLLILMLQRSFRLLEIHWTRWASYLPACTVGGLGAFWTVQRAWIMLAPAR